MWRACACSVSALRYAGFLPSHLLQQAVTCSAVSGALAASPVLESDQQSHPACSDTQLAVAALQQDQQLPGLLALWQTRGTASPCYSQQSVCTSSQPIRAASSLLFSRQYRTRSSRRHNLHGSAASTPELNELSSQDSAYDLQDAPSWQPRQQAYGQHGGKHSMQQQRNKQRPQQRRSRTQQQQWYTAEEPQDKMSWGSTFTSYKQQRPRRHQQWQQIDTAYRGIYDQRSSQFQLQHDSWQQQQQQQEEEQPIGYSRRHQQNWKEEGFQQAYYNRGQQQQFRQGDQYGSSNEQQATRQGDQYGTSRPRPGTSQWNRDGSRNQQHSGKQLEPDKFQQQRATLWEQDGSHRDTAAQRAAAVVESSRHSYEIQQTSSAAAAARTLDPAALTNSIGRAKSLPELQNLLQQYKDQLQQINVCAAFKAVVRLSTGNSSSSSSQVEGAMSSNRPDATALAIMRQLSSRMQAQIRTARPWDLAQAAWACSKLQYREQALLNAIAQQAVRKAPILLSQDIAQLASAFARLKYSHKPLMQLLQQQTLVKADAFEPWSLVHTAWALEIAGAPTSYMLELLTVIAQQLGSQQIQKFKPLDVATLLWLMASHEFYNSQLLEAIGQQLTARIAEYPPAAAAQALISVAGLGYYNPDLAAAAAAVVQQRLEHQQYSPKQVAQTTFALVKLGHANPELLEAAAAAFVGSSAGSYSPQLLCMMCWAMLLGGHGSETFTEKLVQECHNQLPHFTADQIASIIRGMFRTPSWSEDSNINQLLSAAAVQLPHQLPDMTSAVLGKLIVTLSKQQQYSQEQFQFTQQQPQPTASSNDSDGSKEQQQEELQVLLQQCGQEWLQRQQQQQQVQVTEKQLNDVRAALAAAGLSELAAATEEVQGQSSAETSQEEARQYEDQLDELQAAADAEHLATPRAGPAVAAQQSSWLDSFVASADDK